MKKELEQINGKIEELKVKRDKLSCDSKEYLELLQEQVELEKEKLELIESHKESIEKVVNFKIGSMEELDMILAKITKVINSSIQSSSTYEEISKLLSISKFEFSYSGYIESKNKVNKVKEELNKKYYKELNSCDGLAYIVKVIYNLLDKILIKKEYTF